MSKKNYTKFSTQQPCYGDAVETAPEESVVIPKIEIGVITDCVRLNVRSKPTIKSESLCVIDSSAEFEIDRTGSTPEFYRVFLPNGIVGYCMKKFVTIKP